MFEFTPHTFSDSAHTVSGYITPGARGGIFHTNAGEIRRYTQWLGAEHINDETFDSFHIEEIFDSADITAMHSDDDPVSLFVSDWAIEPITETEGE